MEICAIFWTRANWIYLLLETFTQIILGTSLLKNNFWEINISKFIQQHWPMQGIRIQSLKRSVKFFTWWSACQAVGKLPASCLPPPCPDCQITDDLVGLCLCCETTSASCLLCSKASSCFGEGFHAASVLQSRFYLFNIVLFPVKAFFSDCLCSVRRTPHFQPSSGKSELFTLDLYEACRSVGDLRLYLQFISTGWTSLLHRCGPRKKKRAAQQ